MLSGYFDPDGRRIRALRDGPAGALFDGFAHALSEAGYATITARRYLRAAEHFIYWTDRNRLSVQQVNEESLAQFGRHLGRCRCPHQGHADRESLRQGQPDDVERVIASCDPESPVGRRDRAILLLLARLGLRAGDVAHLRLRDIDWQGAWIHVCGKSRRETRLPLSQEVGQAIVGYLQHGRPRITIDTVFVRCRAPLRALDSPGAVTAIVARALRRAGVARPSRGAAHLLRHSVATSMLRHGASLQDIGALLRHRSIETTQIYAKVDVTALQSVAQPWPEVQPC